MEDKGIDHLNGLTTHTKVDLPLGKDDNSLEANKNWTNSYVSIIVVMFYLGSNKIPYISFYVHQFTQSSDETETKRIFWYLKVTKYKGLVINTYTIVMLNCCVGADFAVFLGYDNTKYHIFDKSRIGFFVMFSNFLYCGCQIYKYIFLSICYILIMWNFFIMLETYLHWRS